MIAPAGTPLLKVQDLKDGTTLAFKLGEGDWPLRGFAVRVGDAVHAYVNRCPHAGHQLNFMSDNFLTPDGARIICRSHGAQFDKQTGACLAGPCPGEALKRIEVAVEAGEIRLADAVDIDALATRYW